MSKRQVGKRLPESVPSEKCSEIPTGVHVPDPASTEWCMVCEEWIGDGSPPDKDECYRCGGEHQAEDCDDPYVCDICDMDGPMDGSQFDYSELDPGVRNSVKFLRDHGFWTTDSGDGKTKFDSGWPAEEILNFPHVFIVVEPRNMVDESRKLAQVLGGHGITVQQVGLNSINASEWFADQEGVPTWDTKQAVEIEASYDPMTDVAVLMVSHIHDDLLLKCGIETEPKRDSN